MPIKRKMSYLYAIAEGCPYTLLPPGCDAPQANCYICPYSLEFKPGDYVVCGKMTEEERKNSNKEMIVESAMIATGDDHSECFNKIKKHRVIQGFITDRGRFLNRKEALDVAKKAGQIVDKHRPYDQLLSEDLK